ncbi:MAG: dihydroorotate dehydrogenase-like protein [Planctomycetales bacterium]
MDLRTNYLGIELRHPVVASASPLSETLDGIRRLEDAGASAIVMFSLFEEQIRHESDAIAHLATVGTDSYAESLSYFPEVGEYRIGPERYLDLIRRSVEAADIPIIGSLNGVTAAGWIDYARQIEQAGATALELNIFHIPANPRTTAREVEARYVEIVRTVRHAVKIPLAVKLGPYFSAMGEMADRLDAAGADGLVLFNRFYQPDFDLDRMEVVPNLELSTPSEIRLPLLWIAVLHGRIRASLAATTGVESATEVVKYLLAGADVAMTTSALMRHGPEHLGTLVDGLRDWMTRREYESVRQMQGAMSQQHVADPSAFERANYIRMLQSYRNPFTDRHR